MHNQLEEYLNEVAERLGSLPIRRRNEEIKEMRQHLQNAVIFNQEFGQANDEAVANAIEQFGEPQELAQSLIRTWQREARLTKRSFWGAAAYTSTLLFLQYLTMQVVLFHTEFCQFMKSFGPDGYIIAIPWNIGFMILPGCISGALFRKRSVQGTALGVLAWQAIYVICILAEHQQYYRLPSFWIMSAIGGSANILASWVVSRWQQTRRNRAALLAA